MIVIGWVLVAPSLKGDGARVIECSFRSWIERNLPAGTLEDLGFFPSS